jgi:bacteriocin-like protein
MNELFKENQKQANSNISDNNFENIELLGKDMLEIFTKLITSQQSLLISNLSPRNYAKVPVYCWHMSTDQFYFEEIIKNKSKKRIIYKLSDGEIKVNGNVVHPSKVIDLLPKIKSTINDIKSNRATVYALKHSKPIELSKKKEHNDNEEIFYAPHQVEIKELSEKDLAKIIGGLFVDQVVMSQAQQVQVQQSYIKNLQSVFNIPSGDISSSSQVRTDGLNFMTKLHNLFDSSRKILEQGGALQVTAGTRGGEPILNIKFGDKGVTLNESKELKAKHFFGMERKKGGLNEFGIFVDRRDRIVESDAGKALGLKTDGSVGEIKSGSDILQGQTLKYYFQNAEFNHSQQTIKTGDDIWFLNADDQGRTCIKDRLGETMAYVYAGHIYDLDGSRILSIDQDNKLDAPLEQPRVAHGLNYMVDDDGTRYFYQENENSVRVMQCFEREGKLYQADHMDLSQCTQIGHVDGNKLILNDGTIACFLGERGTLPSNSDLSTRLSRLKVRLGENSIRDRLNDDLSLYLGDDGCGSMRFERTSFARVSYGHLYGWDGGQVLTISDGLFKPAYEAPAISSKCIAQPLAAGWSSISKPLSMGIQRVQAWEKESVLYRPDHIEKEKCSAYGHIDGNKVILDRGGLQCFYEEGEFISKTAYFFKSLKQNIQSSQWYQTLSSTLRTKQSQLRIDRRLSAELMEQIDVRLTSAQTEINELLSTATESPENFMRAIDRFKVLKDQCSEVFSGAISHLTQQLYPDAQALNKLSVAQDALAEAQLGISSLTQFYKDIEIMIDNSTINLAEMTVSHMIASLGSDAPEELSLIRDTLGTIPKEVDSVHQRALQELVIRRNELAAQIALDPVKIQEIDAVDRQIETVQQAIKELQAQRNGVLQSVIRDIESPSLSDFKEQDASFAQMLSVCSKALSNGVISERPPIAQGFNIKFQQRILGKTRSIERTLNLLTRLREPAIDMQPAYGKLLTATRQVLIAASNYERLDSGQWESLFMQLREVKLALQQANLEIDRLPQDKKATARRLLSVALSTMDSSLEDHIKLAESRQVKLSVSTPVRAWSIARLSRVEEQRDETVDSSERQLVSDASVYHSSEQMVRKIGQSDLNNKVKGRIIDLVEKAMLSRRQDIFSQLEEAIQQYSDKFDASALRSLRSFKEQFSSFADADRMQDFQRLETILQEETGKTNIVVYDARVNSIGDIELTINQYSNPGTKTVTFANLETRASSATVQPSFIFEVNRLKPIIRKYKNNADEYQVFFDKVKERVSDIEISEATGIEPTIEARPAIEEPLVSRLFDGRNLQFIFRTIPSLAHGHILPDELLLPVSELADPGSYPTRTEILPGKHIELSVLSSDVNKQVIRLTQFDVNNSERPESTRTITLYGPNAQFDDELFAMIETIREKEGRRGSSFSDFRYSLYPDEIKRILKDIDSALSGKPVRPDNPCAERIVNRFKARQDLRNQADSLIQERLDHVSAECEELWIPSLKLRSEAGQLFPVAVEQLGRVFREKEAQLKREIVSQSSFASDLEYATTYANRVLETRFKEEYMASLTSIESEIQVEMQLSIGRKAPLTIYGGIETQVQAAVLKELGVLDAIEYDLGDTTGRPCRIIEEKERRLIRNIESAVNRENLLARLSTKIQREFRAVISAITNEEGRELFIQQMINETISQLILGLKRNYQQTDTQSRRESYIRNNIHNLTNNIIRSGKSTHPGAFKRHSQEIKTSSFQENITRIRLQLNESPIKQHYVSICQQFFNEKMPEVGISVQDVVFDANGNITDITALNKSGNKLKTFSFADGYSAFKKSGLVRSRIQRFIDSQGSTPEAFFREMHNRYQDYTRQITRYPRYMLDSLEYWTETELSNPRLWADITPTHRQEVPGFFQLDYMILLGVNPSQKMAIVEGLLSSPDPSILFGDQFVTRLTQLGRDLGTVLPDATSFDPENSTQMNTVLRDVRQVKGFFGDYESFQCVTQFIARLAKSYPREQVMLWVQNTLLTSIPVEQRANAEKAMQFMLSAYMKQLV